MHPFRIALFGSLAFLPIAQAGEIAEPVCEEKAVSVEQIPKGFVCDESSPAACPTAGDLSCIGRTVAGTRFWIDRSSSTTGAPFSLEQMKEFETAFQSFRRPQAVDPAERTIRVYDADGKTYVEKKIRFGGLPRDVLLDVERSSRSTSYTALEDAAEAADDAMRSSGFVTGSYDPRMFLPIQVAPTLAVSGPCQ